MGVRGIMIEADGFDVQSQREPLLGTDEIEKGGAEDTLDQGEGMVERGDAAVEAMEDMLVLVDGGEDGSIAPEEIDVARKAGARVFGEEVEFETEELEIFGGVDGPGIALGGEERRAWSVESAQSLEDGRVELGLGEVFGGEGVFAEIDEARASRGVSGRRPGNDEDGVLFCALCGPAKEHLPSLAGE